MGQMPKSWAEIGARLDDILAETGAADEWLRQALDATYGERQAMTAVQRSLAFQKACGTLFALEDIGDGGLLPFHADPRSEVQDVFARFWGGVLLPGPPWRMSPTETLPRRERSDFDYMEEPDER